MEEQDWAEVVAAATRAPSIHNTQPWLFVARGDILELHLDRERALPVLDPSGRQQIISCGVAVELALVALRGAGHEANAYLLPDPADPDHLANIQAGSLSEPSAGDRALVAAISDRHTVRAPFQAKAVPEELLTRLREEAEALDVWLKPITESEEEVATVFLISRAEEIEQGDPAYLEELERWMRTDPSAVDGVPVDAVPSEDPASRPSNWLIRDFVAGTREEQMFRPGGDPDAPPPAVERPTVVLLGTGSDSRAAWLRSGRALGRVLLQATAAGLAASPLTQALDWPATRERLRERLRLVGYPQMLLRMGYPAPETAVVASGRRPVGEVLRFAS